MEIRMTVIPFISVSQPRIQGTLMEDKKDHPLGENEIQLNTMNSFLVIGRFT